MSTAQTPHWTLQLKQGLKINVPADFDNPVTLTLLELEDWPEPEVTFCCQLTGPGLRVLDADTGYGLYALSLAQALRGQGGMLALNPDPLFARSVADNGLQAVIHTEGEAPTRHADRAHSDDHENSDAGNDSDHRQPAAAFDLIRLGASTPLDTSWLQQADPLFLLPSDSAALGDLQAAGLSLYRLIPALNALVALQEVPDANADREPEPSAPSALEKPAILFACNATRAAWLREQGRLIQTA